MKQLGLRRKDRRLKRGEKKKNEKKENRAEEEDLRNQKWDE
jgi:hypothetical protein